MAYNEHYQNQQQVEQRQQQQYQQQYQQQRQQEYYNKGQQNQQNWNRHYEETCNQIRASHKNFERQHNLISSHVYGSKAKIKESFRCKIDNNMTVRDNINFNRLRKKDLKFLHDKRLKYRNKCIDKRDKDKSHNDIIKEYKKRTKQCGKMNTKLTNA